MDCLSGSRPRIFQPPEGPLDTIHQALVLLANIILQELSPVTRRKCEHLINQLVQQRDVTRSLIHQRMLDIKGLTCTRCDFIWTWRLEMIRR